MQDYSNYRPSPKDNILWSANKVFNQQLEDNGFDIIIDDIETKALIRPKYQGNEFYNFNHIKVIKDYGNVGSIVEYKNKKWIIVTLSDDNEIYKEGIIQLCNNILSIQIGTERTQVGTDPLGRPIYEDTPIMVDYPCIVDSKLLYNRFLIKNEAIQLPDGRINVAVSYKENHGIKLGVKFHMYNTTYEIMDVDFTDVRDGKGVIYFMADRRQN